MFISEEAARASLSEAGLAGHADALLSLSRPSIRLRSWRTKVETPTPLRPTPIKGLSRNVVAVAASDEHALAVLVDGSVVAWGNNGRGQLGDGTRVDRSASRQVLGLDHDVVAVAAGAAHCLALRRDASVVAWGWNGQGQLGDGTVTDSSTPVPVRLQSVTAIAALGSTSFALTDDGSVWAWGANHAGDLGDGSTDDRSTPGPVLGLRGNVRLIAPRFAILGDGSVRGWGFNGYGQVGDGTTITRLVPVDVPALRGVTAIVSGGGHVLALRTDGSVLAWGANWDGELGDGTTESRPSPVPVEGLGGAVTHIAAGRGHSLAVRGDGSVVAWGKNRSGQLGDGTTIGRLLPVAVDGLNTEVVAVAADGSPTENHSYALTADGSVLVWGTARPDDETSDASDGLFVGTTKLGGAPDLPAGTDWPMVDGRPLTFVAQIDLAEVAPFDSRRLLPATGLLSFFYDTQGWPSGYDPSERDGWRVRFSDGSDPQWRRLRFPASLPSSSRLPEAVLWPSAEITLPPFPSLSLDQLAFSHEDSNSYQDFQLRHDAAPMHHLLGHEEPIQRSRIQELDCYLNFHGLTDTSYRDLESSGSGPAPGDWVLLLQVDSDSAAGVEWGDVGRLYYWIQHKDLLARRFDNTWLIYQSH